MIGIGALLAKIGIPLLVDVVAGALGKVDHPAAKIASEALGNVKGAIAEKEITPEQIAEANRHVEMLERIDSDDWQTALKQVNQTIRTEAQSEDSYVRRWRPTFGYCMAYTWTAEAITICLGVLVSAGLAIFGKPDAGTMLLTGLENLIEAMTLMWSVALSVVGVNAVQRSRDKAIRAGKVPGSLFGTLIGTISGKR